MKTIVSAGVGHSLILKENGDLFGIGDNQNGQLGVNKPQVERAVRIAENIASVNAGNLFSLTVDKQGKLSFLGSEEFGKLSFQEKPVRAAMPGISGCNIIAKDGSLWFWGNIGSHKIGYGTEASETILAEGGSTGGPPAWYTDYAFSFRVNKSEWDKYEEIRTIEGAWNGNGRLYSLVGKKIICKGPFHIADNVKHSSAGGEHFCVIFNDSTLSIISAGQVYEISSESRKIDKDSAITISGVETVSAGLNHVLILRNDGTLLGLGNNKYSQVVSSGGEVIANPVYIMDDIKAISAGSDYSLAIKNDGSLLSWGLNKHGRLGSDASEMQARPPEKIFSKVSSCSAGATHAVAVTESGDVYTWGGASGKAVKELIMQI